MKKILFVLLVGLFLNGNLWAAGVQLTPTISPAIFHYNDQITVTYDVTGTSLASLSTAYVWVWIPNTTINAKYNITPATSAAAPAQCTKSTNNGKTLFTITFKPSDFFSSDISAQTQLGILLKGIDWSNGQTADYLANFLIGNSFQSQLISPAQQSQFVTNGNTISVQASATSAAKFVLSVNNNKIDSLSSSENYSYTLVANDSLNFYQCFITVSDGTTTDTLSFNYLFSQASPTLVRPQGIIDGINYSSDNTKVTLSFWAPNKSSVYAFGDFTDWSIDPKYLMNRDGEHFWIEVDGLTPQVEYAFQYLVDNTLKIADPYSDKILDTQDTGIPSTTYPNLKPFPAKAVNSLDQYNRLSIIQTGQTPYQWQVTNFQKPKKENMVIYELLIRDFFDSNNRNYQNLIDTISYFKKLGIDAIELMPIAEFSGNDSWGYNPTFMFAPDKYYGTKNKLKEFVDKCHANGIAVIMDMVLNHQDIPNSYAMLEFDFGIWKPTSSNKWFNVDAPHPYSVFNDLNHESSYTRQYVDTINYYWVNQYKIDGFRYDLSKGFTQFNSGTDVGLWSQYDQSRVNNLQRMMDKIWSYSSSTYVILEHFAVNQEDQALAEYRSNEGLGALPWEKFNSAYNQNTMGYVSGSDFSGIYYANNGWSVPHAVGYMESHDEERLMYNNITKGNSNSTGSYNIKKLDTALVRMKAAAIAFYTIPGPKMLWEFGELGYDKSITLCTDGTLSSDCNTSDKPVEWVYLQDPNRKSLHDHIADLIRLRKNYNVFTSGTATVPSNSSSLVKQIALKNNPYTDTPSDSSQMNVQIVVNFDIVPQNVTITFPHAGTWYDYYNHGQSISVPSSGYAITLPHGMYKLYTDVRIQTTKAPNTVTGIEEQTTSVDLYPNPTHAQLSIKSDVNINNVTARSITGAPMTLNQVDENVWDMSSFSSGLYIIEVNTDAGVVRKKIIKN